MKIKLFLFAFAIAPLGLSAQITTVNGPTGSGRFGTGVIVLTNGNYVVTDPLWDDGPVQDVGAVYLYNGQTHALISKLTGSSAGDRAGWPVNGNGVTALPNGNYVVNTYEWHNGAGDRVGAVTWCNGSTGISGVISAANSLVGSSDNDVVGAGGITVLSNGNYVVDSYYWGNGIGAVTWCNGNTGKSGMVSASNSLLLRSEAAENWIASTIITALTNGNYVVVNTEWGNRTGAVTWGNGSTGTSGVVSAGNSLVGSKANDLVSVGGVVALSNGNYVISSTQWSNGGLVGVGAVTWGNGSTGTSGVVSTSNSLVGSKANDQVGDRVFALSNGNYVVASSNWDNGATANAGAVTWGNGSTGISGVISAGNSLVGSTANDRVGSQVITMLSNGNYLVNSPEWNNWRGAVTWCNGSTGTSGTVSAGNSLVGSTPGLYEGDRVGSHGATELSNGNYVVRSPYWWYYGESVPEVGAVTWGNGSTGTSGVVSAANSLVGSRPGDRVGYEGITALSNGNYVVSSRYWDNGALTNVGAATWGNGSTGTSGFVSTSNSLVGSTANDQVGANTVTALSNGNYVVNSPYWDNGMVADAGAVTWGNGNTGTAGVVSAGNSLVGSKADDQVGYYETTALPNGNYVTKSPYWDNGAIADAGAATWGNGSTGTFGSVSAGNSLVGSNASDRIAGVVALPNGNYLVASSYWDNGGLVDAGALTIGDGEQGATGTVNVCNSIFGTVASRGDFYTYAYNSTYDYYLLSFGFSNFYAIHNGNLLASDNAADTRTASSGPVTFSNGCNNIAVLNPVGEAPASGPVTAKVYTKSTALTAGSQSFVRRYYNIAPAANENTATGKITLFYSQSDFNDFNEKRGSYPAFPTGPADGTGIANLRITQQHGTSSTGDFGSYTGWSGSGPATVLINPADDDIVWNSVEKRWEVSFSVTGFSGFFAHSSLTDSPLPVNLVSLAVKRAEGNALLQWKTTNEVNISYFGVERSVDAKSFQQIGQVRAAGSGAREISYSFTDMQFSGLTPVVYYRLRSVDQDGSFSHSRLVSLNARTNDSAGYIYPNPVKSGEKVSIAANSLITSLSVTDITGRTVHVVVNKNKKSEAELDLKNISPGLYLIKCETEGGYEIRKLIVE